MADIINRSDVLNIVAAQCGLDSEQVNEVLKAFEGAIGRSLSQGGEVRIAGFGTFKTSARAARTSRNPRTGEPVAVPARTAARFIPGKGFKAAAAEADKASAAAHSAAPAKQETKAAKGAPAKGAPAKAEAAKSAAKPAAKSPTKADAPAKKAAPKGEAKAEKAPAKKKK